VTLAASFGCPFEGRVDPGVVADHAHRMAAADDVVLADTIGVGVPGQVKRLLDRATNCMQDALGRSVPLDPLAGLAP
jgi:isopropylmalate/homocitrate/citramalate synthase